MQRVDTLIKKLQEQFAANAPASQLAITVQMLQAELAHIQSTGAPQINTINVDIPQTILPPLANNNSKINSVIIFFYRFASK